MISKERVKGKKKASWVHGKHQDAGKKLIFLTAAAQVVRVGRCLILLPSINNNISFRYCQQKLRDGRYIDDESASFPVNSVRFVARVFDSFKVDFFVRENDIDVVMFRGGDVRAGNG